MNTAVHFSSATDEWETPQTLFDELNREFGFTLDICATPENAKCPLYFTKGDEGGPLTREHWSTLNPARPVGCIWMNPPYGRTIGDWIQRARKTAEMGTPVVCLLPARTDTAWFHDHIKDRAEIRFLRGRLKFGNAANCAPFPSMIVVFRPEVAA